MINKFIMVILCIFITSILKLNPINAEDQIIINSDPGGRLIQAAMYPIYVIFLKGGNTGNQKDNWIDKDYWASLDILEGPDKGKSVLFKLHPTRNASIQPEWCFTVSEGKYLGRGITCLKEGSNKELRFPRVIINRIMPESKLFFVIIK